MQSVIDLIASKRTNEEPHQEATKKPRLEVCILIVNTDIMFLFNGTVIDSFANIIINLIFSFHF